ncbi:hypothetical protein P3G55_04575 [Leptospira sp. 96542]|nr:hypothetical protein [Leptospira sp. 96542]
MKLLRSLSTFIIVFILMETVALSAVIWSFYESLQNALKQEAVLSDHRARDLVLALAKSSEPRLDTNGFLELEKLFSRFVEVSNSDPEQFFIREIHLYNTNAVLLTSSDPKRLELPLEKRKSDDVLLSDPFFKKGIRMKKWEWSEPNNGEEPKPDSFRKPEIHSSVEWVLAYLPLANQNQVKVSAPLYKENQLEVVGLVVLSYERGNLLLLFENQWKLTKWMFINFLLIGFVISILITGFVWFVQFLLETDEVQAKTLEASPPMFEKKMVIGAESKVEAIVNETTPTVDSNGNNDLEMAEVIPPRASESKVLDAIFLG